MSVAVSTNYSGRLVDLLVFQGTKPDGMQKIVMSFGDTWQLTTGIQKVCQTFTTIFLTRKGTVANKLDYGTNFMTAMQSGSLQTEEALISAFTLAAADVKRIMIRSAQDNELPADEQIASIELLNYSMDKSASKITLNIKITTAAGTSLVIYVPVSVPIR